MYDDSNTATFHPDAALADARTRNPPVWPLPRFDGRAPVVIGPRRPDQAGIDLAYQRGDATELAAMYPPGSENGTARYFMPSLIPAFCVNDGAIVYARQVAHGYAMVIDHGNGWATHFANLEHMFARPTDVHVRRKPERVKSGDVLGFVGALQAGGFKCLHFEVWHRDDDGHFADTDPTRFMRDWLILPWKDGRNTIETAATAKAAAA